VGGWSAVNDDVQFETTSDSVRVSCRLPARRRRQRGAAGRCPVYRRRRVAFVAARRPPAAADGGRRRTARSPAHRHPQRRRQDDVRRHRGRAPTETAGRAGRPGHSRRRAGVQRDGADVGRRQRQRNVQHLPDETELQRHRLARRIYRLVQRPGNSLVNLL